MGMPFRLFRLPVGYAIQVIPVASCAPGVDTPEDVRKMEELLIKQ